MAQLGLPDDYIAVQRESLILAHAIAPGFLDEIVRNFDGRLDDPGHVALLKESWEAMQWQPNDPRLEDLADRMVADLLAHPEYLGSLEPLSAESSPEERYEMINEHGADDIPTSFVLTQLIHDRLRAAGLPVPELLR